MTSSSLIQKVEFRLIPTQRQLLLQRHDAYKNRRQGIIEKGPCNVVYLACFRLKSIQGRTLDRETYHMVATNFSLTEKDNS